MQLVLDTIPVTDGPTDRHINITEMAREI